MKEERTSRIPEFHKYSHPQRTRLIAKWADLSPDATHAIRARGGLTTTQAANMVENVIGLFSLPLGIATNFLINSKDYLIPMVIEEPSVIAACSHAAKLFRAGGGLHTTSDSATMIGQVQILEIKDPEQASHQILMNREDLLKRANETAGNIAKRGGGATDLHTRVLNTPLGPMLVVHLLFNTQDAMGANAVNTAAEHLAPYLEKLTGGRANLRILSNLCDHRKARAEGTVPAEALARDNLTGQEVIRGILEAATLAELDPYRAATHNKGIMNGIDAVLIATGNDWRAVEAGAHAYAARGGVYTSLSRWQQDENGDLRGSLELPMAIGTVGGATRVHPTAQTALRILGIESARELAEVVTAAGLAQNLGALRALATEGIQHGHMRMHARQLAIAAGADDNAVAEIAQTMIAEQNIRLERAKELVTELQERT